MLQRADRHAVAADGASAAQAAGARVEAVQGEPYGRYRLAADFYRGAHATGERRRYGLAELRFLDWEIARGVLAQPVAGGGGSPWWRAINDELLRDKVEADLIAAGSGDEPSSRNVSLWLGSSPLRRRRPGIAAIREGARFASSLICAMSSPTPTRSTDGHSRS